MLPVSLGCLFLIAPLVFSNVYLKHLWITKSEDIIDCVRIFCFVTVTGVWKNNNNVKCLQSTIDVSRKDYDSGN